MPLYLIASHTNGTQFTKRSKLWAYPGQHDDFVIVIPPDVGDEIKNVGPEKLSFLQAVEDVGPDELVNLLKLLTGVELPLQTSCEYSWPLPCGCCAKICQ